ncbi:MAG: glycosyltransferase family 2 protein [Alphaproteobacteria bacterium]
MLRADSDIGQFLIAKGLLRSEAWLSAIANAKIDNKPLSEVLQREAGINKDEYFQSTAQYYNLPYADLAAFPPDISLFKLDDMQEYVTNQVVPWKMENGRMLLATAYPGPDTLLYAMRRYGSSVGLAVASDVAVKNALQHLYGDEASHLAVHGLKEKDIDSSASTVLTFPQKIFLYILASCILLGFAFDGWRTLLVINIVMTFFYLGNFVLKSALLWVGGRTRRVENDRLQLMADNLRDEDLPVYSILVPMYKEARILEGLVQSLQKLDYPPEKLDIKLVLEQDDLETLEAAKAMNLDSRFDVVIVPTTLPKTKPKACNYALHFCRGDYIVIYDAEDKPEPDQLRKAVATFNISSPKVVCLQACLNYYNAEENWLTRLFTLDYSLWFDFLLPGLEKWNIPIPLGGTSNHFRIAALREVWGWDPYNVTEDADLGLRLARKGYSVSIVPSTTFEEANCHMGNWVKQRSRWIKGYFQTFFVHLRTPIALWRTLGTRGFFGFLFFIGGTMLSGILNPIFWAMYIFWLVSGTSALDPMFPGLLFHISLFNLMIGNGIFIFLMLAAPVRRGWLELAPFALTVFLYWVLMSIAAWRALIQLVKNPFYWDKTVHGISKHKNQENDKGGPSSGNFSSHSFNDRLRSLRQGRP